MHSPDEYAEHADLGVRRQLFGQLARAVTDTSNRAPLPLRLCRTFVDLVGAEGGAITLAYGEPERTTVCVTDSKAVRLEDMQEVLGQGPGPDAYRTGRLVKATFPGAPAASWPMLETSVLRLAEAVTIHAFPMHVGTEVLGVVTVHSPEPSELLVPVDDAQFLADAVGAAIARQADESSDDVRWDARDRIHQATGMVVAQVSIEPSDALALMRAFAFSHSMSLDEVATDILQRRQDFSENADFRGNETS